MIGARVARMSAVLALIAGLLGMHALVVIDSEHVGGPTSVMSSATPLMHPPTSAPMTTMHDEVPPSGPPVVADVAAPVPAHDGSPHPGAHQLLHLCLAVLAALLVLTAFAGLLWFLDRRDASTGLLAAGNGRREPPRRPPPTSVRLAQLCVMRN